MDLHDSHPELYHYTSEAGLRGILQSNSVWATSFEDLNDSQEIIELREPLTTALAQRFIDLVDSRAKGRPQVEKVVSELGGRETVARSLASSWTNALYTATFDPNKASRNLHCFIASFCSHAGDQDYERENGLLSQWRGYGRNGGYCLVFDTKRLAAMLEREYAAFQYTFLEFIPAHYRRNEPIGEIFPELFDASSEAVEAALRKQTSDTDAIFKPFVTASTRTKHCGFYEEREIRLVACATTELADSKIKDLPGYVAQPLKAPFPIKYGDLEKSHIALFGEDHPALPLVRVIVGPSVHQHDNQLKAIEVIPNKIPVHLSATPFIG